MAAPHLIDMPGGDPAARKAALRKAALARRAALDPALGGAIGKRILAFRLWQRGEIVAGIWPMRGEPDIRPLLHALHDRGCNVVLPETPRLGEALIFRIWTPGAPMVRERFGTERPDGPQAEPNIILVPCLAFDRQGRRLGYGGGFYDRTLAARPQAVRIGFSYAALEAPELPDEPMDQRVPVVATERDMVHTAFAACR